ncbi:MAG: integrase core domain-containing protein [Planctomycetaceae bacterium]|nr:integrase core domain-containing protein [Planctomycetaceae bacterium]
MYDRDTKFTNAFDAIFDQEGAEGEQTAFRSPSTNAFVERFIQTLQQEVLDHFVVFGEQHMDHLVSETVEHYHDERPLQSLGNEPPVNRQTTETPDSDTDETKLRIVRRERLSAVKRVAQSLFLESGMSSPSYVYWQWEAMVRNAAVHPGTGLLPRMIRDGRQMAFGPNASQSPMAILANSSPNPIADQKSRLSRSANASGTKKGRPRGTRISVSRAMVERLFRS